MDKPGRLGKLNDSDSDESMSEFLKNIGSISESDGFDFDSDELNKIRSKYFGDSDSNSIPGSYGFDFDNDGELIKITKTKKRCFTEQDSDYENLNSLDSEFLGFLQSSGASQQSVSSSYRNVNHQRKVYIVDLTA